MSDINQLMAEPAPAIYSNLFGADLIVFTKQAKAAGLFEKKVFSGLYDSTVLKQLGADVPKGAIGFERAPWFGLDDPKATEFIKAFETTNSHEPSSWSLLVAGNSVNVWAAAVAKAGTTDGDAVVKALENGTYPTFRGPVAFRPEDHQAPVGEYYGKIEPGECSATSDLQRDQARPRRQGAHDCRRACGGA